MTKKIEEKFKPCPFCGQKPRLLPQEYGYSVDCSDCAIVMRIYSKAKKTAVVSWNKRDGKLDPKLF